MFIFVKIDVSEFEDLSEQEEFLEKLIKGALILKEKILCQLTNERLINNFICTFRVAKEMLFIFKLLVPFKIVCVKN